MANENRINQPWKKLLEDETAFPGEGLPDKAAAWQQLYQRLHLQSRRKRLIWYWVAAACLLLAVTVPFAFFHDDNNNLVKDAVPAKEVHVISKPISPAKRKTVIAKAIIPAPIAKKTAAKIETSKNDQHAAFINDTGLVTKSGEKDIANNLFTPVFVDSTTTSASATVAPKKQLKVVHVNELGDPVVEPSTLAHNAERHSFELQIGKEEVVTNTAVSLNKPRLAVLTIKTSPTN